MLVNFSVSNFLSFNEEQTFSMVAGRVRENSDRIFRSKGLRLKKCAAVFGSNAAGKSNLIQAIAFLQKLVTSDLPKGFSGFFFRLDEGNMHSPSTFKVQFLLGDRLFEYTLSILLYTGAITEEQLFEITPSTMSKHIIFTRNPLDGAFIIGKVIKNEKSQERVKLYAEDALKETSAPFLRIMNQNKAQLYENDPSLSVLRDIYTWFQDRLTIRFPAEAMTHYFYMNDVKTEDIAKLLNAFGTGIHDVEVVTISLEDARTKIPEDVFNDVMQKMEKDVAASKADTDHDHEFTMMLYSFKRFFTFRTTDMKDMTVETFEFIHEKENVLFELKEESDGTARLLELLEILMTPDDDSIYLIDELDRCLNPLITREFVRRYLNLASKRQTQLIFSTNESTLLNAGLLRNDEIEFVSKNSHGESKIQSLDTMRLRSDRNLFQAYFQGNEFNEYRLFTKKTQQFVSP